MNANEPLHDGWSNLETCVVYAWLTNEEADYRFWRRQAEVCREEAPSHHLVSEGFWTPRHAAIMSLSDELNKQYEWHHPFQGELAEYPAHVDVYSELLDVALNRVNWRELAEEIFAGLEPDNEPDPEGERTHEAEGEPADSEAPKQDQAESPKGPRFELGRVVSTPGALAAVTREDIAKALARHHRGDWGDVGPVDWQTNQTALEDGDRLFSVYHGLNGVKFWVITEADRSATTILLPGEY